MTVETDLNDLLKAIAPTYPDVVEDEAPASYLVYQQIGGEAPLFLERAVPSKKNGRIQITAWAETRIEASALILQVEAAMVHATAFEAKPLGAASSTYDTATSMRGAIQDYSVWSDR